MIRLYDPEDLLALQILKKKKRNSLSAASESQENKRTDAKKKKHDRNGIRLGIYAG